MKINSLILFFQKLGDEFDNSDYRIKNYKIKSYQQSVSYRLNHHATAGIRKAMRMKVYD